jgi:hypothetical protein
MDSPAAMHAYINKVQMCSKLNRDKGFVSSTSINSIVPKVRGNNSLLI